MISFSLTSQNERWKQKNARINFAISPQFEYVKIAGKFEPTGGIAAEMVFNNSFYFGGYLTKKMLRDYIPNPLDPVAEIDVNYQHMGIEFLYCMKLGLYRTKGGHYVNPKLRIVFGGKFGGGYFCFDDINKEHISIRDYFYYVQPQVGVAYPISNYISMQGGFCFTSALKVNLLDQYFPTKDFTGPGVYISAKITLFK